MIGKYIGKYKISGELGKGGMGIVYKAHDSVIGRDVAIKVIQEKELASPRNRERFYNEAKSAGRLNHENITTIYDVGKDNEVQYIVMELLSGTDLRSLLKDDIVQVTLNQKLTIALQICKGLKYAHDHKVIHRDIKPDNIRILDNGTVKIMDFGIARLGAETGALTHSSIGTPQYMSPEQVRSADIDHRSDIFSFGVLLYEMLTGINPFTGDHPTAVIYNIINVDPNPVTLEQKEFSQYLQAIIEKCIAKEPENRYADCSEVINDLNDVLDKLSHEELSSVMPHTVTDNKLGTGPKSTKLKLKGKSKPYIPFTAATGGIILLAVLSYLYFFDTSTGESQIAADVTRSEMISYKEQIPSTNRNLQAYRLGLIEEERGNEQYAAAQYQLAAGFFRQAGNYFEQALATIPDLEKEPSAEARERETIPDERETSPEIRELERLESVITSVRQEMRREKNLAERAGAATIASTLFEQARLYEQTADRAYQRQNVAGYREAEESYNRARAAYNRASLYAMQRSAADNARDEMDRSRQGIYDQRTDRAVYSMYQQAEEARVNGFESYTNENFGNAEQSFSSARELYDSMYYSLIRNSVPAELSNIAEIQVQAEDKRSEMLALKAQVPNGYRTLHEYLRAVDLEQRGDGAFAAQEYEKAKEDFVNAAELFRKAEFRVNAEQAVDYLATRFKQYFEAKDVDGLRSLSEFYGDWDEFFKVAQNITVSLTTGTLEISDEYATVPVNVRIDYLDNRNRGQQSGFSHQWTIDNTDTGWIITRVSVR
jgi:serine/threonine protein kinase